MYIQEENKNRMSDTTPVDTTKVDPPKVDPPPTVNPQLIHDTIQQVINDPLMKEFKGQSNETKTIETPQPKKSKAELIADAEAELASAGEDADKKAEAEAKLQAAKTMPDEVSGGEKAPPATDMYNIDGEKGVGGEFKYSDLGAINAARAAEQPPRDPLFELKSAAGGGRRTRRRNKKSGKKSGKKSRRQSKKGGKKHCKTGSKKSKKSRRYSSRK